MVGYLALEQTMEQSTHLSSQEINYLEMWNNFQGIWKQLPQEKEREDYEAISWKPQTTKNPPQEKKKSYSKEFCICQRNWIHS